MHKLNPVRLSILETHWILLTPVSWLRLFWAFRRSLENLCFPCPEELWDLAMFPRDSQSWSPVFSPNKIKDLATVLRGKQVACMRQALCFWEGLPYYFKLQEISSYVWKRSASFPSYVPSPGLSKCFLLQAVMCLSSLKFLICQSYPTQPLKWSLVSLFPEVSSVSVQLHFQLAARIVNVFREKTNENCWQS